MLEWCKGTLSKHKSTLMTGIGVVSGAVATAVVCKNMLLSWQRQQMELFLGTTHVEQNYLQHHSNISTTLSGYFVKLKNAITAQCDTETTLLHLKDGSVDKVCGWKQLQQQILTRALLTLYSSTFLATFLSVQLAVVKATIVGTGSDQSSCKQHPTEVTKITKTFLSKVHHLLDVSETVRVCENEVERLFGNEELDTVVNCEEVVERLICGVEDHLTDFVKWSRLCKESNMDENTQHLVLVIIDLLESQEFRNTFDSCLRHNASYMQSEICISLKGSDNLVLAKLLPLLNKISTGMLTTGGNQYVRHILDCRVLKSLTCNVYEGCVYHVP